MSENKRQRVPQVPQPAQQMPQEAPAAGVPTQKKRGSKYLTLWIQISKEMGYNVKGPDGKLRRVPRKGTPEYDQIRAEYNKRKAEM